MRYQFTEVLNDLIDYFLVGDPRALLRFKHEHRLSDNLGQEFLSNDSGDQVVNEGILLPIPGISNFPYTVLFTIAPSTPVLLESPCRLQHRRDGYFLHVENQSLVLFTWRILEKFTEQAVEQLLNRYASEPDRPMITLANGWYRVEVLAGWASLENPDNPSFDEAVFEFVLHPAPAPEQAPQVDLGYPFTLDL